MKAMAVAIACVGVTLILVNELLHAQRHQPEIIYKYVPRDLDTYLKDPEQQPMYLYSSMFQNAPLRTF